MPIPESILKTAVIWRGQKLIVEMNIDATLKDFGNELQKLTDVKSETMRLIVPQFSSKSSKLLYPFSDGHSSLRLQEIPVNEVKPIRMMGVPEVEVDEVLEIAKKDLRIVGFDEEERRSRRMLDRSYRPIQLPQGAYIFCDFRTLQLPGVELHPPASEALRRMHMLAADPGIVAIMNKHRWRVGVMSEMAPVGYVGVSPKCILGLNKNHGEEISLRLRTDDLKGFRKYESIKKTLLHELAHMVYSEHDANFYALDKQLNQEAGSLDWTRSQSQTLSGIRQSNYESDDYGIVQINVPPQKLGGNMSDQLASARASSVAAAYRRMSTASINQEVVPEGHAEPDPDDSRYDIAKDSVPHVSVETKNISDDNLSRCKFDHERHPDVIDNQTNSEPDPDDHLGGDASKNTANNVKSESNIRDSEMTEVTPPLLNGRTSAGLEMSREPDPDDSDSLKDSIMLKADVDQSLVSNVLKDRVQEGTEKEPDPDDLEVITITRSRNETVVEQVHEEAIIAHEEPELRAFQANKLQHAEPDPDDGIKYPNGVSIMQIDEPDPDDQELKIIQDPVSLVCSRIQKAMKMLQSQVNPMEAMKVMETLVKIIRNVIEHPDEMKFKRLRKANPVIQRNIVNSAAAMEILSLIGFSEDVLSADTGKAEACLALRRNDPGLLWLAKSSIETCMASW
ncbi:WLM domain-containing protein [Psidium guajava]|nr:WLM domain-containing protein [Psidium guajava]